MRLFICVQAPKRDYINSIPFAVLLVEATSAAAAVKIMDTVHEKSADYRKTVAVPAAGHQLLQLLSSGYDPTAVNVLYL